MGLPKLVTRSACHTCGEDHTTKRCTNNNHKPRPPRIAIRLDNPGSAAASIINNMDQVAIRELRELLEEK